ncbi:MAG: CarD family transcriptional regulator [Intestinibacter bartlettii]|uniref:CarD family transcriptional regulator n=1 Tax=Intestinibacter bartlettii TaxID=261299 RepID=UPI0026F21171|nr:CarD family transcriptional regulator [Intestinibacter bartlettii]MDO5011267.1 CarD family transcriptional regulator [Intestinibacter bartlettii]
MFNKGEYVIYGNVGVCEIMDISTLDIHGAPKDKLYYILKPLNQSKSTVFTPIDNKKVVIRKIISKEDVETLLSDIKNIKELLVEDERFREKAYKECIKSCQCRKLLSLIKTIYYRKEERLNEGKKLSATDEKYFKIAQDNLHAELSMSLKVPIDQMEDYILDKVQHS